MGGGTRQLHLEAPQRQKKKVYRKTLSDADVFLISTCGGDDQDHFELKQYFEYSHMDSPIYDVR